MFNTIKDFSLDAVGALLAFFYSLPVVGGSYGLAIIMLTATVMIVLMPLTIKATRSTIKMTQLQPELRKLQKEYKDDKPQLNQAMMALYQENGVNPVGGCLPMLAQLPVFLILFNVLRGITRRVSDRPYFTVAERARELTGVESVGTEAFDPNHLEKGSQLYRDLSSDTEMLFGPFDLAVDAWQVVQNDFLGSLPYILLILFVVGSSYFQQRQVSARRGSVPDNPTPQQQTQQQLLRILPLMSGVWSFLFPAGLVLYWATSNLFRIGQQSYITRALYSDDAEKAAAAKLSDSESKKTESKNTDSKNTDSKDSDSKDSDSKSGGKADKGSAGSKSSKGSEKSDSTNGTESDGELIGDGRPGRRNSGRRGSGGRNGSSGSAGAGSKSDSDGQSGSNDSKNGSTTVDREQAWAQKRAQRSKAQASKKKSSTAEGSSRVTPKGTKPPASKKKRKR